VSKAAPRYWHLGWTEIACPTRVDHDSLSACGEEMRDAQAKKNQHQEDYLVRVERTDRPQRHPEKGDGMDEGWEWKQLMRYVIAR
jgi:hypothetical protein